ncbi:6-hydroxy-D-nicotine oxidase [Arthrobacter sp. SO5]|uniref:FAD-binding oxidoreductase n=1 Tax=Arthrobacter sp. SO5 TaxID=1897055 RepID=UPI001E30E7FF|nr:FAD-binding oxidoreductase [Arthrobacter sp. SO5]MCB5273238.1 6-hydroxy-D-nicotine oxidase [Arthrobacter sp. SO5]
MLGTRTVRTFADGFGGEVIRPGDPKYDAARAVWNGLVDRRPGLVVRPNGTADVVTALRFAREQDLVVAVRGGGHSIPGFSTCDDGIVIDLSRMRGATIDPTQRTAVCAAGALLSELDDAAQSVGLVCPVGVVSHTGVAGLTLGGGMGRLQRKFGLTIDNLRSVEFVTADGGIVRASADENPDLFWGVRGAGANFGVATSFEYVLHPLDHPITHGTVVHPIDRAGELAQLFTELAETGPDELWLGFYIRLALPVEDFPPGIRGRPVAALSVLHCGRPREAERDLARLRAFGPPVAGSIEPKPHLAAQRLADESSAWGHRFYMKSAFLRSLPGELVELAVQQAHGIPEGAGGEFGFWSWGRAIAEVSEDATAFTGRTAAYWMGAEIQWDDPALDGPCREWARAGMADVERFATRGRYVNDVAESREDARTIYGDGKYERLVGLKRAWDPDNVFRMNQNIRP